MAMVLSNKNINISQTIKPTPATLNTWLTKNEGYVSNDLVVWASLENVDPGKLHLLYYTPSIASQKLLLYVQKCLQVLANIRESAHWVLLTGWDAGSERWRVNDPQYNRTMSYATEDMSLFVVYG
jgi:hypothetical protein